MFGPHFKVVAHPSLVLLSLPLYKLTISSLKMGPKSFPQLTHGSKAEIKESSGVIFRVTIAYPKENSKIKDKFFKKILTQE